MIKLRFDSKLTMSEKSNEEPNEKSANLNESNEDGEILTLTDLLNEQRQIDEVNLMFSKNWNLMKNNITIQF